MGDVNLSFQNKEKADKIKEIYIGAVVLWNLPMGLTCLSTQPFHPADTDNAFTNFDSGNFFHF